MAILPPRFFKILSPAVISTIGLAPFAMGAGSATDYPGSSFIDVTPDSLTSFVDVSEVSGVVVTIANDFDDDSFSLIPYDPTVGDGLAEARVEIDEGTNPSLAAGRNPTSAGMDETALGLARTFDTLENMAVVSGVFDGNEGNRYEISAVSTQEFTLEYNVGGDLGSSTAVIELMPMQLVVFQGTEGATPAEVSYSISLSIDGDTIFEQGMRLSGTSNVVELTALTGVARTDGTFFDDPANNAFGVDFPAVVIMTEMGEFFDGEERSGELTFEMTVVADDSGWGGYAAPAAQGDMNLFVPIPEPSHAMLLGLSLLLALRRRRVS